MQPFFSPMTPNRRDFAEAPMKSTSIGHRLKQRLEVSGLYAGERNHGFRRGQIQSMPAQGMTKAQIGYANQNLQHCRLVC